MIKLKASLIVGFLGLTTMASAQYTGRVFVDQNNNGSFDKNEKALADVSVSDGLHVVKTDKHGIYHLEGHDRMRFVFITTPSGYKTNNAYYRRISEGVKSYDFGVQPYNSHVASDGSHRFVQITDTEIRETQGHDDWVGNIRDYTQNANVSFVIQTGDICYIEGMESHIKLMNTANMGLPMFYVIGNHDLVAGNYGEEVFEKLYGPTWYSFDVGSVHYVVTPMRSGDYEPSYNYDEVCRWLKNDLALVPKGTPIFVFNHDLMCTDDHFVVRGSDKESIDLDEYNFKAQVYGHWHINYIRKHNKAYSISTSTPIRGGIDHASAGFRVFNVDGKGDFSTELRYTYLNKNLEIASVDNLHHAITGDNQVPLVVNTYNTVSPTQKISYVCTVDGKKITPQGALKQQTDFSWMAKINIPSSYEGKLVTVNVTATYANGETAQNKRSFFYQPKQRTANNTDGQSWTNLLGSSRHVGVAKSTLSLPLQLNWVNNVGGNIYMTSPIIANNRLYIATVDEDMNNRSAIVCLDAITGEKVWKYPTKGSIKNTIAFEKGNVFAQDIYGNLYAVNAETGKLSWTKKLQVEVVPGLLDGLATDNGKVFAGAGRGLAAFDAVSGKELWRNTAWSQREGCTATLAVDENVVIGHTHWGALHGNDLHTGKHLWSLSDNGLRNRSASPCMKDGLLYLISNSSFFIIEPKTGNVIIQKSLGYNVDVTSTPLITDDEIIFGTAQKGVVALDRHSLSEKWTFDTKESLIFSSPYTRNPSCTVETSPVLSGNIVYVAASDGVIYGLDRNTGKQQWKHATGAPCFSTVTIVGNSLYAADFGGNVYGFTSDK